MQFYTGGVLNTTCGVNVNHAMLLTGYGTDPGAGDFWRLQNSWGAAWGEKGFVRLGRGPAFNGNAGQCGVQLYAALPAL